MEWPRTVRNRHLQFQSPPDPERASTTEYTVIGLFPISDGPGLGIPKILHFAAHGPEHRFFRRSGQNRFVVLSTRATASRRQGRLNPVLVGQLSLALGMSSEVEPAHADEPVLVAAVTSKADTPLAEASLPMEFAPAVADPGKQDPVPEHEVVVDILRCRPSPAYERGVRSGERGRRCPTLWILLFSCRFNSPHSDESRCCSSHRDAAVLRLLMKLQIIPLAGGDADIRLSQTRVPHTNMAALNRAKAANVKQHHRTLAQRSLKNLNLTKTPVVLGMIDLPAPEDGSSTDNVDIAKERVRRLSLSSAQVENLERTAKSTMRTSIGNSPETTQDPEEDGSATGSAKESEPLITCKSDLKVWTAWAKKEAAANNELMHPRLMVVKGAPRMTKNPSEDSRKSTTTASEEETRSVQLGIIETIPVPLNATADEIMEVFGVGVRLYFDATKLFIGIAVLGILTSIPSFVASLANIDRGGYSSLTGAPTFDIGSLFALTTLGARVMERDPAYGQTNGCSTHSCLVLNTLTAGLDVLYVILVFMLVREFRKYAMTLSMIDGEVNVRVEDYTIQIFGFDGLAETEPELVKKHIEASLVAHATARKAHYSKLREYHQAKLEANATWNRQYHESRAKLSQALEGKWRMFLDENCQQVADVTLIVKDRGLLRRLVKLVPLEMKLKTAQRKRQIAEVTGAGGCKKSMLAKAEKVAQRRLGYKHTQVDEIARKDFNPIGAFVTFERERAKHVAMELWRPRAGGMLGRLFGCICGGQPSYARFNEKAVGGDEVSNKRLTSYLAPRPQNVLYENLAVKFAFDKRAAGALLFLVCILVLSIAMAITAVAVKSTAKEMATILFTETGVLQSLNSLNSGGNSTGVGAVADPLECTAEQTELIDAFGSQLTGDLLGTVNDLLKQAQGASKSTSGLKLLVALLSCQMVPLLRMLVTIVVIVLNVSVTATIHGLVEFCRYDSLTAQHTSTVSQLALVQFLNTGITAVLINFATGPSLLLQGVQAPIPHLCWYPSWTSYLTKQQEATSGANLFACIFGSKGIFFRGDHFDFGPRWYRDVGASLCITLFITIFMRSAPVLITALIHSLKKKLTAGGVRHLEAMKALYLGPVPRLAFFLGKMIAFAALCILFSTLMPICHIFLLVYLLINYWIDKLFLLRICRTPTPYDASFVHATLSWVPWVLLLKLIFGYWAFGSLPGFLTTDAILNVNSAVGSGLGTDAAASQAAAVLNMVSDNYLYQRTQTIASVLMAVGIALLIMMMVLSYLFRIVWSTVLQTFALIKLGDGETDKLWPAEYPKFSDVIKGEGVSSRVRILKRADPTKGQREVLALPSDVDGSRCAGMNPVQGLLWLFTSKRIVGRSRRWQNSTR